ncbi:MAG: murein biosynthesis integral membrane protein MurJ [Methylomicrobium sp.]
MIVGGLTMLSRILGFVRDMLIARLFGVDSATDAFFVAFKIPNFLRRLFTEGAFTHAFIPVIVEKERQSGMFELKIFLDKSGGSFALIMMSASVIGMLAAPILVVVFAPGFWHSGSPYALSVQMLRIMMPYLFFVASVAFAGAILNARGHFIGPVFAPVLLNLSMIVGAIELAPMLEQPVTALAWSVLFAGFVQLALQLALLSRLDVLPRLRWGFGDSGVTSVLRAMGPAVFAVSVTQINLLLDTFMASFLETGSVSWLYYSDRLVEFPLGVLGIALSTVILPKLAQDYIADNQQAFSKRLDWGVRLTFLMGLPASVGLAVLAQPVLSTLFQSAQFSTGDVHRAGQSLAAYAAGLVGFIGIKMLLPGFSSRKDLATPLRFGIYTLVINMLLNLLLIGPLGHAGLALATSLAAFANAGLLLVKLGEDRIYKPDRGTIVFVLRVCVAVALMGGGLAYCVDAESWQAQERFEQVLMLTAWIGVGIGLYVATLLLTGMRLRHVV